MFESRKHFVADSMRKLCLQNQTVVDWKGKRVLVTDLNL